MACNTAFRNNKTRSARYLVQGSNQGTRYLLPNLKIFGRVCARHQLATGIDYSNTCSLNCRFELLTHFTANRFRIRGTTYHPLNWKLDTDHTCDSQYYLMMLTFMMPNRIYYLHIYI